MASQLGDKIKKLRKKQKLTLGKLSVKAKLSKSYLWELENGKSHSPSAEKLIAISDVFGVSINYFLDSDVREPKEMHLDEAFFRRYKNLQPKDKEQLNKILEIFEKE